MYIKSLFLFLYYKVVLQGRYHISINKDLQNRCNPNREFFFHIETLNFVFFHENVCWIIIYVLCIRFLFPKILISTNHTMFNYLYIYALSPLQSCKSFLTSILANFLKVVSKKLWLKCFWVYDHVNVIPHHSYINIGILPPFSKTIII